MWPVLEAALSEWRWLGSVSYQSAPTPLVCFLLKPELQLSRGLNFPPVVRTQI